MELYEEAVLDYVSAPPGRFVAPQFYVPLRKGKGDSQPDFLVLDYSERTAYVVEVTSASTSRKILSRLAERESRWLSPVRDYLAELRSGFSRWKLHVTVFVRDEICGSLTQQVRKYEDVSVISLDKVLFSWRWDWDGQVPRNPLQ